MNDDIKKIIGEICKLDNSLKKHSLELEKIVNKMITLKPNTNFDEHFKIRLKNELRAEISNLNRKKQLFKPKKNNIVNYLAMLFKFSGVFVAGLIIILIIPFFNNKPTTKIQNVQDSSTQQIQMESGESKIIKNNNITPQVDSKELMDGINIPKMNNIPKKDFNQPVKTTPQISDDKLQSDDKVDLPSTTTPPSSSSTSAGGGYEDVNTEPPMRINSMSTASTSNQDIKDEIIDLGYGYSKDGKNIYYNGVMIAGADPSTFVVLKDGYAKDKNNEYYMGEIK